ncbi:MAG: aminotransferase class III-fold pyridoxal phosphate-dependent enzyme [Candidatus Thorarchaeota archaeon]
MTVKKQERPDFDERQARTIANDLFGITGSFSELPSERDRNFLIYIDATPRYILKISAAFDTLGIIDFQNKAIAYILAKNPDFSAPLVVPSLDGDLISTVDDSAGIPHYVRLLTYVQGRVFAKANPHTDDLLFDYGRFLGSLTFALDGFDHPETHRDFVWDLKNAPRIVAERRELVHDRERKHIVDQIYSLFDSEVVPHFRYLRTSVAHNDANDYNVLVDNHWSNETRRFGIIDFGDMIHTVTISDLAIGIAYAVLDKQDPLSTAMRIVAGYHSIYPLTEDELQVLFPMVCMRLTTSVCMSAYQITLEPENEYLRVSEAPAWRALDKLKDIHPRLAWYAFRSACGLSPHPKGDQLLHWLEQNQRSFSRMLDTNWNNSVIIDQSVGSLDYGNPIEVEDFNRFSEWIQAKMRKKNAAIGIGRYDEARLIQTGLSKLGLEPRSIHLGIDIFTASGSPVYAPLDGTVHTLRNNDMLPDFGPTIILLHKIDAETEFYTLYGHLSVDSIEHLIPGQIVRQGESLGRIGEYPENGGWPPHLHFQIILDMLDFTGDYYGSCSPNQRPLWLGLCPDPNLIMGIPSSKLPEPLLTKDKIIDIRHEHFGKNLSLSYDKPLKIVRGFMQYLYDDDGRTYLDVVNNVPSVGHSHPRVVEALQDQAKVLCTNTRYLHDNLARYVEALCAKFPAPLSVCFLVNSGSEANELAIRLAKAHTKRDGFIVLEGGYHGNTETLVELSHYKHSGPGGLGTPTNVEVVSNADMYRSPYGSDKAAGNMHAEDVGKGIKRLGEKKHPIAAFLCEPVMSCGGQIVFPPGYLESVYKIVRDAGGVCIADEVQIGFGRMGTHFWGFETQNVIPDIVTLGKPIGNGHPIGAVVTTPEIAASFATGMEFFSTTGGNTVSCHVGLAVLEIIEDERLQENALDVGTYFKESLIKLKERHQLIGDVRGYGLFLGVELVRPGDELPPAREESYYIVNRMKQMGVLLSVDGPLHNVLKIKPPLCFTKENVDEVISKLDIVLSEDFPRQSL